MTPSAFAALRRAAARMELDRRERERRARLQETCRRLSAEVTRQMAEERERELAERQRVQDALKNARHAVGKELEGDCGCTWEEGTYFPCASHRADRVYRPEGYER